MSLSFAVAITRSVRFRTAVAFVALAVAPLAACLSSGTEYTDSGEEVECELDSECEHGSCEEGGCTDDRCPMGFVDVNGDRETDGCECAVEDLVTYEKYTDQDGDGAEVLTDEQLGCTAPPSGYETPRENFQPDCDDSSALRFPGHGGDARDDAWLCDGLDNDCDGDIDESCCTAEEVTASSLAPVADHETNPLEMKLFPAAGDAPTDAAYLVVWQQLDTFYATHIDETGSAIAEITSHSYSANPVNSEMFPQGIIREFDVLTTDAGYELYWYEAYYAQDEFNEQARGRVVALPSSLTFPDSYDTFSRYLGSADRWGHFHAGMTDARVIVHQLNTDLGKQLSVWQYWDFERTNSRRHTLHGEPIEDGYGESQQQLDAIHESPLAFDTDKARFAIAWLHGPTGDFQVSYPLTLELRLGNTDHQESFTFESNFTAAHSPEILPTPSIHLTEDPQNRPTVLVIAPITSSVTPSGDAFRVWRLTLIDDELQALETHDWRPETIDAERNLVQPTIAPNSGPGAPWRVSWIEKEKSGGEWRIRSAHTGWTFDALSEAVTSWRGDGDVEPGIRIDGEIALAHKHSFGAQYRTHFVPISASGVPLCP